MDMFKDFDHLDSPIGRDGTPYAYFEEFRDWAVEEDRQIGWSESHGGFWVVVGYAACREIQHNPIAFSNRINTLPVFGVPDDRPMMLGGYDEPDHSKYRKLVQGPFSPRSAAAVADLLRASTNDLIDRFIEDGSVDIVAGLANEVPSRMTAIILGLPPEDGDIYRTWTHAISHAQDDPASAGHVEAMERIFNERLAAIRADPGDDVLSGVAQTEVDGEMLSDREIYDFFVVLLLAGIDNTTKLLSNVFWRLAWDRELRRRLIAHPELIPGTVDEALRYYSPAMTVRVVKDPITLHGCEMKPDQLIVKVLPIANRDPRQFPDPDAFIPDRSPNRHLALGLGIHRCLGAHLLKIEGRVAIEEVLRRIPDFELDPDRSPRWLRAQIGGMEEVPIVFPPGPREGDRRVAMATTRPAAGSRR